MKKFKKFLTVAMVAMGLTAVATQAEAKEKDYTTDTFMVQYMDNEGMLEAKPVNPRHKGGYLLDNKYEIGDIVEVTYNNDDIIEEHKLTGKELKKVEKKYKENIDSIWSEGEALAQHQDVVTRNYVVQNIDEDGFMHGEILSAVETGSATLNTAKKKYSLGDIVNVTFNSKTGEVFEHHELNDTDRTDLLEIKELMNVMKDIMKDGKQTKDLVMAEDGTFVNKSFHQ